MSATMLGEMMAKARPKTLSIKLHVDVIETARIVAAYRGEPMADMLSAILRPILTKMEKEEVARRGRTSKGAPE